MCAPSFPGGSTIIDFHLPDPDLVDADHAIGTVGVETDLGEKPITLTLSLSAGAFWKANAHDS